MLWLGMMIIGLVLMSKLFELTFSFLDGMQLEYQKATEVSEDDIYRLMREGI